MTNQQIEDALAAIYAALGLPDDSFWRAWIDHCALYSPRQPYARSIRTH